MLGATIAALPFSAVAADDEDRLPTLAAELVRFPAAVIISSGGRGPALAAKAATTTIPLMFAPRVTDKKEDLRLALDVKRRENVKLREIERRFVRDVPSVEQPWDISKESKDQAVSPHQVDHFPRRTGRAVKRDHKTTRGGR